MPQFRAPSRIEILHASFAWDACSQSVAMAKLSPTPTCPYITVTAIQVSPWVDNFNINELYILVYMPPSLASSVAAYTTADVALLLVPSPSAHAVILY